VYILLSNDDGYQAEGLCALAEAMRGLGRIDVVAPDRNRSGASNSLTLNRPLYPKKQTNDFISVDGTPTDCVHLAITGLLTSQPDMVVTGINRGPNMGDDVHYSGTVAGAMEGRSLGFPSIAVSLASSDPQHYDCAARVAQTLVQRLLDTPLPQDTILNVNVPDLPWESLQGLQAPRLGNRHKSEPIIDATDPHGERCYWVGPPGAEQDAGPGTDFHAVGHGYVSVTPILVDITRHTEVPRIQQWLDA